MKLSLFLLTAAAILTITGCHNATSPDTEFSANISESDYSSSETVTQSNSALEASSSEAEVPPETTSTSHAETAPTVPQMSEADTTVTEPAESPCSLLSVTVSKEKNRNMCASLAGVIDESSVTFNVSAPTDSFSLRNAVIDFESDGISVEFSPRSMDGSVDLLSPECTCTVTNSQGLFRVYDINVIFESTIPTVSIDTVSGQDIVSKEDYTDAVIRIDCVGADSSYLPTGFDSLDTTAVQIRGRGNSTWDWDKKPYKLKFPEKTEILGMAEAKKWTLLSNYADYSLIRNYVAMEATKVLSRSLCPYSQYPVNLFLNGEYQGVYTIGEDHEVKKNRIDLPKDNGEADTSFLLEIGGYNDEDVWDATCFTVGLVRFCSIEYPEDTLTAEQSAFIIDYCKKADAAVQNLNGYEEYIDVDSLVDWFISTELFYNLESCFRRSCFMTKEPGGKLTMGPVWDYDLALGNLYNDFGQYEKWAHLTQSNGYIEDNWFCYLLKDPAFVARLKARWNEVKDDLLATALSKTDHMGTLLSTSAKYNFIKWDILGTRAVPPQPWSITGLKTYEDNVAYIRSFITNRWNWMDSELGR